MIEVIKTKFKAGKYLLPATMIMDAGKIRLKFQFSRILLAEVKSMEGARWNPEAKEWSVPDTQRNRFQLEYLQGRNPYERYDRPLVDYESKRPLYDHQLSLVRHALTYHYCIWAAEMGCLHRDTLVTGKPIKDWYNSKQLPVVKCYDEYGNVIKTQASRIIKKTKRLTQIKTQELKELCVSKDHLFLTYCKDKLCHTLAKNLTVYHSLVTDGSFGTSITLNQSTHKKKHIGSASGMEMVRSTNKMIITEVSYLLKKLNSYNNLPLTLTALRYQIMESLSCLVLNGLLCPENVLDSSQICGQSYNDILFEEYSTQMDLFRCKSKDHLELFIQLYAMLQKIYSMKLQLDLKLKLSQDMELIKYQSTVEDVFKNWDFIYTRVQHDISSIKQIDFENPMKSILARESDHLIPDSLQQMKVSRLLSVQIIEKYEDVYDLTIPQYGNYFDDQGFNHQNTGKTLAAIEVIESIPDLENFDIWYVGPKSGVKAVNLELRKWESTKQPIMLTYDGMKKRLRNWMDGIKTPRIVIFDESSKLKGPATQQSLSALALANGIRNDWGEDGFVIEMSGTPAPKSPLDWWMLCEVACPGFLKEGDIHKLRRRLAIIEDRENPVTGGTFPQVIGWLDNEDRCGKCGKLKPDPLHLEMNMCAPGWHSFVPTKNEVAYMYERMKGLVIVMFKKDCLDLPEKQYIVRRMKPEPDTMRAMGMIRKTAPRAAQVLTLCRELSDGFQYIEVDTGIEITCPRCLGTKKVTVKQPKVNIDVYAPNTGEIEYDDVEMPCDNCRGMGMVAQYARDVEEVPCPKDNELINDLMDHADIGRCIVWGGFTGSIDRITKICMKEGWAVLRVDGRGYHGFSPKGERLNDTELLIAMDRSHPRFPELRNIYPLLCFVGHPKAGGMALTLTGSPTEIFFSNSFDGEARMQAEDRGHRPGMDENRGLTIIDYYHLPVDKYVHDNLKLKKNLQDISMGDLASIFKEK